jgi:hypothetical protein
MDGGVEEAFASALGMLAVARILWDVGNQVLTRQYFEKEKRPNFRSVWITPPHDGRFGLCENPRTGANRAPTRTVPIIG